MMLRILLLTAWTVCYATLLAQNTPASPCATDELLQRSNRMQPDLRVKQQHLEYLIQQWIDQPLNHSKINSAGITIPVVFHIVHQNGPENVSDDRVHIALQHLNEAFSHSGPYAALGAGTSTNIQFCLAQRTPDNAPTNGITRHESPLTNMIMDTIDNYLLKNIGRWNTRDYMNVWVVNEISTLYGGNPAGYANYAFEHGTDMDGIVVEAGYFGNSAANDVVLIHEAGHYLNLLHTFSGGCDNINCRLQGDLVCDTPPDGSLGTGCSLFNSCHTDTDDVTVHNPLTTDERDFTENYMDYAPFECQYAFTPGQAERMMAALNTARLSLFESQGCLPPCPEVLVANFTVPQVIVAGSPVVFTNTSTGNVTNSSWWTDGSQVAATTDFTHTFSVPGIYTIDEIIHNGAGCQAQKRAIVQVKCADIFIDLNLAEFKIGDTVQIDAVGVGADAWVWTVDGIPAGNTPSVSHVFEAYGIYQVQLVYENAFCTDTLTREVIVNPDCGADVMQNAYHLDGDGMRTYPLPDGGFFAVGSDHFDPTQVFMARFSASGALLWGKALDHNILPGGVAFAVLSDGNYFFSTGSTFAQSIMVKITPQGNILWQKRYSINGVINKILPLPDGTVWVEAGTYIAKMNTDGVVQKLLRPDYLNNRVFHDIDPMPNGLLGIVVSAAYLDSAWCFMAVDPNNYQIVAQRAYKSWAGQIESHILPDGGWVWQQFTDKDIIHCLNEDLSPRWSMSSPDKPQYRPFIVTPNRFGDLLVQAEWDISDTRYALLTANGNQRWTVKIVTNENTYQIGAGTQQNGWMVSLAGLPSGDEYLFTFPNRNRPEGCYIQDASFLFAEEQLIPIDLTTFLIDNGNSVVVFPESLPFTDLSFGRANLCTVPNPCPEICDNGVDDDGDGWADCADDECDCQPCLTLPNAVVQSVDSVWCEGAKTKVQITVCNTGGGLLPGQTAVAFYDANPTGLVAANPLADVQTIGTDLLPQSCLSVIFEINHFNGAVFVVLNNDYSAPLPLRLNNNFIPAGTPECNYTDNMAQFTVSTPNAPVLDLGEDRVVCPGSATVLTATPGFVRYRWPDGSNALSFTASSTGLYRVQAWDACGNIHTDSVRLTPQPLTQVSLGDAISICQGASATLSVAGFDAVSWWPVTSLDCADCAIVQATPDVSTVYHVTTLKGTCYATDSVRINVTPRPVVSLGADVTLCAGDSVQLGINGQPDVIYEWSNGASDPQLTVHTGGTFVLTASMDNVCVVSDTVEVQLAVLPEVELGLARVLCAGDSTVIGVPAENGVTYAWNDGSGSSQISVQQAGVWILTATSAQECMSSDTVEVQLTARPVVSLGADVTLCAGDSVQLGINEQPDVVYEWSNGASDPQLTVHTGGTYILTASMDNVCVVSDTVAVQLAPLPEVELGLARVVCAGDSTVIGVPAENGVTYAWNDGSGASQIAVQQAGVWILTATSLQECMSSDTVEVQLTARPVVSLGADVTLCAGDSVQLGINGQPDVVYEWSNGTSDPQLTVHAGGTYILTASVDNVCVVSDTVAVLSAPLPEVDLGLARVLCAGDSTVIGVPAENGITYAWNDGSGSSQISVKQAGVWILTATSAQECMSSDTVEISVVPCAHFTVYVPNVFTPANAGNGNEQFRVYYPANEEVVGLELYIYDRWGNLVFYSTDVDAGWDGTSKGRLCNTGVYIYHYRIRYQSDGVIKEVSDKGDVLLYVPE